MVIHIKTFVLLSLLFLSPIISAIVPNISKGHGAILYDGTQPSGPNSTESNSPGQWVSNITAFNAGANAASTITRLYPYSGDIKINCPNGASSCVYSGLNQNVFVGYNTPAYGQASVSSYRASFPNALILAIIDADTTSLPLLSNLDVGTGVAGVLTSQICADPKVDGVFFDLEPFDFNQGQGQFSLYKQTAINLASPACIDINHPKGRVMAIFVNPNKVNDWSIVAGMLNNNGYLVVSAYDVNDQIPPSPTPYNLYTSSVTGKIQAFMDPNSIQYKIPYTVAIPAGASFSEFEQFGYYNTGYPSDFQVSTDYRKLGFTQLAYVQSARAILLANAKSPYYLGTDYWTWSQYISPSKSQNEMLLPNIPSATVISYLQQFG